MFFPAFDKTHLFHLLTSLSSLQLSLLCGDEISKREIHLAVLYYCLLLPLLLLAPRDFHYKKFLPAFLHKRMIIQRKEVQTPSRPRMPDDLTLIISLYPPGASRHYFLALYDAL